MRGYTVCAAARFQLRDAIFFVGLAILACGVVLAETPSQATRSANTLPEYIGVLEFLGERTPQDDRFSASYVYRSVGLALDIDVYAPGVEADDVTSSATGRKAELLREGTVHFGVGKVFTAREAVFAVEGPTFTGTAYHWVAESAGQRLSVHLNVQKGFEEEGHVSRSEVLDALGEIWARGPIRATQQVPAKMNVAIVWDPATPAPERQIWMTYLMTRAAHAARESESRLLAPGDREATFDEEVRARTVAVGAFRTLQTQSERLESAYFSDLDRVEAAGFLREYVWSYLRQPSWGAPPAGLALKAFEAWRAQHLRGHVAVTHGRIALRLATQ